MGSIKCVIKVDVSYYVHNGGSSSKAQGEHNEMQTFRNDKMLGNFDTY